MSSLLESFIWKWIFSFIIRKWTFSAESHGKVRITKNISIHPLGKMNIHIQFNGNLTQQLSTHPVLHWCDAQTAGLTSASLGSVLGAKTTSLLRCYLVFQHFVLLCPPLSQSRLPCSAGCRGNSKGPPERTLWKGKCWCVNVQVCGEYEKTNIPHFFECSQSGNPPACVILLTTYSTHCCSGCLPTCVGMFFQISRDDDMELKLSVKWQFELTSH